MLIDNLKPSIQRKRKDEMKKFEFFECDYCGIICEMPIEQYKTYTDDEILNANYRCERCVMKMTEPKKRGRPPAKKESVNKNASVVLTKENLPELRKMVEGLEPDAPVVVNDKGGKQSYMPYRFDLMDPLAMFEMTKVLREGFEKYGDNENWRMIPIQDHINHLIVHAVAFLAGDTSDEHLSHMMCRAMFAQGVALQTPEYIEKRLKLVKAVDQ